MRLFTSFNRENGGGAIILSGGYDRDRAEADLKSGAADLMLFGRQFIANPDLVDLLKTGISLAMPSQATFYTPDPEGTSVQNQTASTYK